MRPPSARSRSVSMNIVHFKMKRKKRDLSYTPLQFCRQKLKNIYFFKFFYMKDFHKYLRYLLGQINGKLYERGVWQTVKQIITSQWIRGKEKCSLIQDLCWVAGLECCLPTKESILLQGKHWTFSAPKSIITLEENVKSFLPWKNPQFLHHFLCQETKKPETWLTNKPPTSQKALKNHSFLN